MKLRRRNNSGSVLIAVMVILLVVAGGAIAMTLTLQDYSQLAFKSRDEMQALHLAESGLVEVVSWFNTSGTVIAHKWPHATTLFRRTKGGVFPYPELDAFLKSAGPGGFDVGSRISSVSTSESGEETEVNSVYYPSDGGGLLPVVCDDAANAKAVGRVSKLILYHSDYDPLAGTHDFIGDVVAIAYSEGETIHGSRKACYYYMYPWWLEGSPAPIVSRSPTAFAGNAQPIWGEVWSEGPLRSPNESQLRRMVDNDPWLRYRSQSSIIFNDTWGVPTWGKPFHMTAAPLPPGFVVDGTNFPSDGVIIHGTDYTNRFQQNQTLEWPSYDYDRFKRLAKRKGRYFASDAAGNLYRDGYRDAAHLVPPAEIDRYLNTGTLADRSTDPDVWAEVEYDVVFIDTINGLPPAADGSNLPTIDISGAQMSWKGFYYLCANMRLTGTGAPSPIPAKNPDGLYKSSPPGVPAFMDGILNVRGAIIMEGNATVYGSVHTDRGIMGAGTMDVYYNAELANGFPAPIHPVVTAFYKVVN